MRPADPNRNASVEKAHRLLLAFSEERDELGVMDLARAAGLNKSTVSRFVATLVDVGLLERVHGKKKVRLGIRIFELGMLAGRRHPLVERAAPLLERLGAGLRLPVTLLAVAGDGLIVLDRRGPADAPAPPLGRRLALASSAAGRAVLAARTGRGRASASRVAGAGEIERALRDERRGVAALAGDPEPGAATLAAPVRDRTGRVVGALAATASTSRDMRLWPVVARAVRGSAADLSTALGFHRAEPITPTAGPLRRAVRSA